MKRQMDALVKHRPVLSDLPEGVFNSDGVKLAHGINVRENRPVRLTVESSFLGIPVGKRCEEEGLGPINPFFITPEKAIVLEDRGPGFERVVVCNTELFQVGPSRTYGRFYPEDGGSHNLPYETPVQFETNGGLFGLVKTRVIAELVE